MSRSKKKHPGGGIAKPKSGNQKKFRSFENRAKRKKVKMLCVKILRLMEEVTELNDSIFPHDKEYGDEWSSPRDGKQYWIDHDEKWMRK